MLAIYTRLSREDEDSNSINNQKREANEYALINGFTKSEIYNEGEGLSGTLDKNKRPEFNRLISDIEADKITHIWMRKQDRLARSGFIVLQFAEAVIRNNVKLIFGDKGEIDLTDPVQKFHLTIMAAVDELKPNAQSKSTITAIKDNFKEGKTHGKTTYGYAKDKNTNKIIIDDLEADLVRSIFMLSLNGIGTQKIADELNKEKKETQYCKLGNNIEGKNKSYNVKNRYTNKISTKNKSEVRWKAGTVYGMLTNTSYKGMRKYGKGDNLKYFPIPEIIKPHIWEQVNDNLTKNSHNKGNKPKYEYLLKGLMRCGKCGNNYYGRTRKDKSDNFYMCSSKRKPEHNCGNRSINIDFLDNLIWNRLSSEDGIKSKIENYFNNNVSEIRIDELKIEIGKINKSIDAFKVQKKSTIRYAKEGDIIDEILDEIEIDINKSKTKYEQLYAELISLQQLVENRTDYITKLTNLNEKLPFNEKLNIVKKYIKDIIILNGFEDRLSYGVQIKLQLGSELNEMHIINYYYKFRIDVSNKKVHLLSNKLKKLTTEQQEIEKEKIYNEFVMDVDTPADTLEDIEDLILNQYEI
jgi:site-specific DNA recombinase